jgi:tetratricopeptide (TPR) repeat protein
MKPKLVCAKCSGEIERDDKFCPSCGTRIEWDDEATDNTGETVPHGSEETKPQTRELRCDVCGQLNESTAQYCESCGARIEGAVKPQPKAAADTLPAAQKHRKKKRVPQPAPLSSGKVITIAAAIIVIGFAFYLFVIDRDATHTHIHDQRTNLEGGQMDRVIMQEIERLEHELDHHDPENQEAMLRLANLYHDIRRYDAAIRYYNQYLERNPESPDVQVDLGICYFEAGEPERAVETVRDVTQNFPRHQLAAFNLGIIYLNLGEVEPANRYFERAYEINPDNETGQRARRIIDEHSF